jgi:hypothetical protein
LRTTLFPVAIFPVNPMTYLPGQADMLTPVFAVFSRQVEPPQCIYHFSRGMAECQR